MRQFIAMMTNKFKSELTDTKCSRLIMSYSGS